MVHKTMTYLFFFLVSVAASFDLTQVAPIFKDVILVTILFAGITMSLTLDNNRPDVTRKVTIKYVLFSFAASVFFSMLSIAAYIEFDIAKFYLYLLIGTAATLSPQFARKILPSAPDELKKGAFNLFRSFIRGWANKLEGVQNIENNVEAPIKEENNETE